MATINFSTHNKLEDNKSFALLRTNPVLSTNIKLIVDSMDNIFLGAFKAGKSLSRVEYQRYSVSEFSDYSVDVAKFYGNVTKDERYATIRQFSDITAYGDYSYQYEDQYQYGASFNATKLYDEQYKIFAPIWLDKKMPSKFVVYRVEKVDYDAKLDETPFGQNSRILELLKNATIIKTFDLSNDSKVGKYLRKHVNHVLFPQSALTFNFEQDQPSRFNGIDVMKGGFVSRNEYLGENYVQVDYPEIYSNNIITGGFFRNGVAVANIINLEFLFDDPNATNYDIYRYFGLYVDDNDEGTFEIDSVGKGGLISIKKDSITSNYDLSETSLIPSDMMISEEDTFLPTLNYIKDKRGEYHHIKNVTAFTDNKLPVSLATSDTNLFLKGFAKTKITIPNVSDFTAVRGILKFNINEVPVHNDRIFIGDIVEIKSEGYDLTYFTILADNTLQAGYANQHRFSNQGSLEQIAIAIATAIRNGRIMSYSTKVEGTTVVVEDYAAGYKRDKTVFGIHSDNVSNFIGIIDGRFDNLGLSNALVPIGTSTDFNLWYMFTMVGGAAANQSISVKEEDLGSISIGQYFKKKDSEVYSKIVQILADPHVKGTYRLILEKPITIGNDNVFNVYEDYKPIFGRFSAYDFKDFNFDFYDKTYSNMGELLLETGFEPEDFFKGLTPVLQNDSPDVDLTAEKIHSEYDRLKENQLKETAIVSRVVPTITKFALKNGTNARNLPYLLNTNEALGTDNLSPNIDISSSRNPEYLNMEYFHMGQLPSTYHSSVNILSSYIDFANDGILDAGKLKSVNNDYFEAYFKWNGAINPSTGSWTNSYLKKLYTLFEGGNNESFSNTVFRGLRYNYKKRKESSSSSPTEFINNTEVNGYKFGVFLNYLNNETSNFSNIEVIKNDRFKFICVVITVSIITNDVITLNRNLLYTLNDIEQNENVIDIPISSTFNLNGAAWSNGEVLLEASQVNIENGTARFTEQIKPGTDGNYSWLVFNGTGGLYGMKVISVLNDYQLIIDGYPYAWVNNAPDLNLQYLGIASEPEFTLEYIYYQGGVNGWKTILENLTAKRFSERFNQFEDITYTTVDVNGLESQSQFVLEIEDGTPFVKPSVIEYATDSDKPKSYQLSSNEVGKVLIDRTDGGYFTVLRRMNGNYNPLFKNVVTFSDIYESGRVNIGTERQLLIYNRFNDQGISFAIHKGINEDYGYIDNYFFHKVNDENSQNLLKLSQSTDKPPLYPQIGEIAIDMKKINVFKSKYASDYFTKSLAGFSSTLVNGTLSPIEKKTFMASTVMKVKDTYDLTSFGSNKESNLVSLDDIRLNKLNRTSIHWTETDSIVYADFYLNKSIIDELREDRIANSFKKYVNAENSFGDKQSIEDDLDIYISSNIVNRFIIDNIDVYASVAKNVQTEFISVSSVEELTLGNFAKQTGYEIKTFENDGLSFRLIYNKRPGYFYQFKVHVKIQA